MEKRKTFASKDMVGTPRGYVKKEDVERVDREMQPVIDAAGEILPYLPFVGPASKAYKAARGGEKLLRGSTQKLLSGPEKSKEVSKEAFDKAVTVSKEGRNLERMYRAEKATSALGKAKAPSRGGYAVKEAKPKSASEATTKRVGPTNKTGSAAVKILSKDVKSSGPKTRKRDSGTFTSRVEATKKRERTPREKEQFGPLAKRPSSEVTKFKSPGGPVKKYERPGGPVTKYERKGGPVTKYERQGGALTRTEVKDDARIVGLSNKAKAGLAGAAAAGVGAAYVSGRGQQEGRAEGRKTFGGARPERPGSYPAKSKSEGGARPERPGSYPAKSREASVARPETSGSYPAARRKSAGTSKVSGSMPKPERKAKSAASDKSRLAPKMTNFQRMKARQFEKEGVAGRSMTAAQAKRKATEKGSSVADLRKLFGIGGQKKPEAKRSGPLKSAFAKISYQGRKK